MHPSPFYSSGLLELGSFVVTSNVLHHSWAVISELYREITEAPSSASSVRFKTSQQPNCTIIAFVTWPPCAKEHLQGEGGGDFVSSSTHRLFEFLCNKTNPSFSINKLAIDLFESIGVVVRQFIQSQISNSKPLIITGNSLGGSIASLFTLWLLDTNNLTTTKRPLCVTFGSPLIGDGGLQEVILQYPAWNSCFLHVVSNEDPVPRVLRSPHNPTAPKSASLTNEYKPFGTFLLCSKLGCALIEDLHSILDLLMATYSEGPQNQNPNQVLKFFDYGNIVQQLSRKVICKDSTEVNEWISQPLWAGMITQLVAMGLGIPQSIDMDTLIRKTERRARIWQMGNREAFDSNVLNDMHVIMAQLEWYKKCSEAKGIGYYDSYKNASDRSDLVVEDFKKSLTYYWMDMVDEVEKKPQRKGAPFRTSWLFAGIDYRRMIEPLDIAEYYRDGKTNYITEGRSKHYRLLEQWLSEDDQNAASRPNNSKKQNLKGGLMVMEDSCFWAYVEDARISCNVLSLLTNRESNDIMEKHKGILIEFEAYVLRMLKNYAVSPEIFLQQSSFIKWWKDYLKILRKGIMGTCYSSRLTYFMNNPRFRDQYATGFL